jgi:Asp-tRNA(Asn)/Glu-tRNA(Gln) amidotransferase A subunit family amidase
MVAASLISGFFKPYLQKRAETQATKADLEEVAKQMRQTAAAVEEVRSEIAHSDWAKREWQSIRRIRLEELVTALHSLEEWRNKEWDYRAFGRAKNIDPTPLRRIQALTDLYFPELRDTIYELTKRTGYFTGEVIALHRRRLDVPKEDKAAVQAFFDHAHSRFKELQEWGNVRIQIELAAAALMQTISNIET